MNAQFAVSVITAVVMLHVILGAVAYSVFLERKIASWVQDRIGPNRVGPWGLLQPLADGLKLLLKEDYTPANVDKSLFTLAPVLVVIPAMIGWAVIPWGGLLQWGDQVLHVAAAPVNIGVVYVLAVGSMAVYGVVLGGYASNNKFAFLGALRATAQMISYEIPLAVSVLILILASGTLRVDELIHFQTTGAWNIVTHPLLAAIFFTASLAECNRTPFDLAECESELVGGYHTEYSSMRFSLFFLGEYMHMITASAFFSLLFLGGWSLNPAWFGPDLPIVGGLGLVALKAGVFGGKIFLLMSLMMLIRWTIPRFRFDQLMRLAWRSLIPISVVMLLLSGFVVYNKASHVWYFVANVVVFAAVVLFGHLLPAGPDMNRRVKLVGSRFSAA